MAYNLTLSSTALFSTWINVEELNLLIDAGDGLSMGLLQKCGKIRNVFITHPDRDHLTGLPQFVQLNARDGLPRIHYPKDAGSFPAMQAFLERFDPHVSNCTWLPVTDGTRVEIKKHMVVEAIRNEHVRCPQEVHKSLSYKVFEQKRKLKPEFVGLSDRERGEIAATRGREFITESVEENILSFSGDTPVDDYSRWDGSQVLVHEATFLQDEGEDPIEARGNRHSRLEEVLQMVSEIKVGTLVLTHFSSRYSREQIDAALRRLIKAYGIHIPVHAVYPGEIRRDVLAGQPVNG